jgi:hypothetical protein
MLPRPDLSLCPEYTHYYINLLEHDTLDVALNSTGELVQDYFGEITADKEAIGYAPGKWTPRELLGHLIDVERILAYRALRFSRLDPTPLAGFDEDQYIANSNYNERELGDLIHEFTVVRVSSLILFSSLPIKGIDFRAEANHVQYSPLSLGWMIAGHTLHHCRVLKERYV